MAITRDDVARRAGVSSATVSYVINNGPRPVSPQTRLKVLEAIRELGYQPSAIARNLRMQRSSTLGLIIPDTHNPFFSEVARGIERIAFENGFTIFLCHSGYSLEKELKYVDVLQMQRVAGVIWIPATYSSEPGEKLNTYGVPTVIVDRVLEGADILSVTADNYQGGLIAVQHLTNLGHRRIGCITRPVDLSHSKGRLLGYKEAMKKAGLNFDSELIVRGGFRLEDGFSAAKKLLKLKKNPTAIMAYNDMMAIGAIRAICEEGYRIPEDISIVGFDDIAQSAYTCPPLTTVFVPKAEMGQRGVQLLLQLLDKEEPTEELLAPLPVKLVCRASTGPVA